MEIRPQPGFQELFLSTSADIAIGWAGAWVGKTFALLIEPLRHITTVKGFGGVIFRRTTPQVRNEWGLWDTSLTLYSHIWAIPKETPLEWEFQNWNALKFNHLEHEKNIFDHQGAQYPFIWFDELTHFSDKQFWYLVGRNRSVSGVQPYIRATCNPDPDSWVATLIEWWIDQDPVSPSYWMPIQERAGVLRYFTRDNWKMVWGNSKQEVIEKCPHIFDNPNFDELNKEDLIKSLTFIPGSIYDNKKLLEVNPHYLGNLLAQDEITKKQLLDGNWKISNDWLALFEYMAVSDLFSNFVEKSTEKFITCDVARFGRDLAVIMVWSGYEVIRIAIFTKSKTTDITRAIEWLRQIYGIPKSRTSADQDGVWWWVIDEGGYVGFSGGLPAMEDPGTGIKEMYANLKTQCFYRFSDLVNARKVRINSDSSCITVDGVHSTIVKVWNKEYQVEDLIKSDLKAIKRKNPDWEGKKRINSKEEQKNLLNGRSPDCGDTLSQRILFDLLPKEKENNDTLYFIGGKKC